MKRSFLIFATAFLMFFGCANPMGLEYPEAKKANVETGMPIEGHTHFNLNFSPQAFISGLGWLATNVREIPNPDSSIIDLTGWNLYKIVLISDTNVANMNINFYMALVSSDWQNCYANAMAITIGFGTDNKWTHVNTSSTNSQNNQGYYIFEYTDVTPLNGNLFQNNGGMVGFSGDYSLIKSFEFHFWGN